MLHRLKTIEIARRPRARDEAIICENAPMSAEDQKADIRVRAQHVRLTPKRTLELRREMSALCQNHFGLTARSFVVARLVLAVGRDGRIMIALTQIKE